jgi:hypothetical protein
MKIVPNRNMFLDGRRVEAGKNEEVSKESGDLALRHGWASLPEKGKKDKKDDSQKQDDQDDGDEASGD